MCCCSSVSSRARGVCDSYKDILAMCTNNTTWMAPYCCWRLSWREQRVSQPGKGHLWLRSPVWTRAWRDKWPLVVNAFEQTPQTCFFFPAADEGAGSDGALDGAQRSDGLAEASKEPLNG